MAPRFPLPANKGDKLRVYHQLRLLSRRHSVSLLALSDEPVAAEDVREIAGFCERLELVPPLNFWSLCPWGGLDYSYESDAWCLPPTPPPTVQLGAHCRAMVLSWTLRPGAALQDITLETLSQDVVIGLMGVSLMD